MPAGPLVHGGNIRKQQELERVMGIEPTLSAWEAEVLPLNYTRVRPVNLIMIPISGDGPVPQLPEPAL